MTATVIGLGPALLVLAFLGVGVWAALYRGENAAASRRVIVPFLIRVAFPMAVLFGLPLIVLAQFVDLEERLLQALVAGVVIATGWLATAMFGEIERVSRTRERTRDVHKALFAEIRNALSAFWDRGESATHTAQLIERMEADETFVPLIPKENHDSIFRAMLPDIEVLPRETIDAIVAFYSQVRGIQALADDMRGQAFRNLAQSRRIAIYRDYTEMRRSAFATGEYVLELVSAYAEGGKRAATEMAKSYEGRRSPAVSSPDAGPFDPEDRGSG